MSLKKTELQAAIKSLFKGQQTDSAAKDPEQALTDIASGLADAIEAFVKSGEVTFGTGSVTGSTPANGMLADGAASGGVIS